MKKSLYLLLMIFTVVAACKKKSQEPVEDIDPPVVSNIENVKDIKLTITYTVTSDANVPATLNDTVKKAQDLLTKVFSSKDFRDELYKRNFHDSAYSKSTSNCFNRVYGGTVVGRSIAGKAVYDNLLPNSTFSIAVNIRNNGDNTTTLGSASACGTRITTNDYWLKISEKRLAQRLARHWAHEYTHIRGYRHDTNVASSYKWGSDVNQDPAYGVGDVVGVVLDKWTAAGIIK
ncbi:hypothetical protein [Pedobacter sp. ASV28]|jgi:hypothetical protein|uniref:hypothetical protein n=1 Tax=Pedobacter sp. ASV28 TaxID=2795123 RepID=UPI0018EAE09B|nr:hypothetical protein [Pedobacter sp. ASV28]